MTNEQNLKIQKNSIFQLMYNFLSRNTKNYKLYLMDTTECLRKRKYPAGTPEFGGKGIHVPCVELKSDKTYNRKLHISNLHRFLFVPRRNPIQLGNHSLPHYPPFPLPLSLPQHYHDMNLLLFW